MYTVCIFSHDRDDITLVSDGPVADPAWGVPGIPPLLLVKIMHFHAFFGIK